MYLSWKNYKLVICILVSKYVESIDYYGGIFLHHTCKIHVDLFVSTCMITIMLTSNFIMFYVYIIMLTYVNIIMSHVNIKK
mgnify:CR=1 FL=1